MAQTLKKGSDHTKARTNKKPLKNQTQQQLSDKARWQKAAELLKELEKLKFKEAAKAVRCQVSMEMQKAANLQRATTTPKDRAESKDDFGSESYDESSSSEEEDSSDEESSSEEEEESSEEEETESEGEEEDSEHDEPDEQTPPTKPTARSVTRKAVSFSDDENDVRLLSPRKGTKEALFYSRRDIERFRLDERVRKTEEVSANLAALIAAAQITVGAAN